MKPQLASGFGATLQHSRVMICTGRYKELCKVILTNHSREYCVFLFSISLKTVPKETLRPHYAMEINNIFYIRKTVPVVLDVHIQKSG